MDAACGVRRLQRLRMEEKADEEAAPAPMDFTPATPAPAAAEEKGFDPTQCAPPRPCTRRPRLDLWGGGRHRARRAQRHHGCPPGADRGVAPRRSIVLLLFCPAPNPHPDRRAGTASRSASSSCSASSRPSRTLALSTSTTEWRRQEQWSSHRVLVGGCCCHSSGVAGSALSPCSIQKAREARTLNEDAKRWRCRVAVPFILNKFSF